VSTWGEGTWSSGYWGGDVATISQPLTGVVATGSAGTEGPGRAVTVTGASASGSAGTMVPTRFLAITGNSASGIAGTFGYYYWSAINDTQNPNWTVITTF
jgi:hypothetical protein